jgi:3-oxoadipate enol-lactonase
VWAPQQGVLSQRFRVLAYDLRGHGGSDVPTGPYSLDDLGQDVLALLEQREIDHCAYVGLSLGGTIGLWLAAQRPDLVDRLAVVCTSAHYGTPALWRDRAATTREHGMPAVADTVIARWLSAQTMQRDPELVDRCRRMLVSSPPEGYASCCEALADIDLRDQLAAIKAPTLVVAGAEDVATPVEHAEAIMGAVENARLAVIDGAAHLANVERPDEVTRLVENHLADLRGPEE